MTQIWPDAPLRSQAEDEFDRVTYAVHAARLISSSHSWDDSVVFGVTGAWGSGKTSMLAMIEEEIRRQHQPWRVARFTPWATSDVAGLLGDFYATLTTALPQRHAKQVREALGILAEVSAPAVRAVPHGGSLIENAMRKGGASLRRQTPIDVAIDNARVALRGLDTPLLVVADDVDRLQSDELLSLLKVIRLLGRFPGVHYLLAYDEATLFSTLAGTAVAGTDDGAASRFMEKVVQYPLVLPALSARQLSARVEQGVEQVMAVAGRSQVSGERMSDLEDVFRALLPTPRAVDRFLAQLRYYVPLLAHGEINDEDVVILTLLRTAFPVLYAKLPLWPRQLTSGNTGELREPAHDFELVEFEIDPLLQYVPAASRPDAARLLRDLFPNLPTPGPRFTPPFRPRGVSDDAYFERYFTLSIPAGDVSDVEVAWLVAGVRHGKGQALHDRLVAPGPAAEVVLTKAATYTRTLAEDDELRLALIETLIPVLDEMPSDGGFFTSSRGRATRWLVALLNELTDDVGIRDLIEPIRDMPRLYDRAGLILRVARAQSAERRWRAEMVEHVAAEVANSLVEHVARRDEAPTDQEPGWQITFLAELRQGARVRTMLTDGIEQGRFTVEDVAARFVSVDGDEQRRLSTSRRDEFEVLAPTDDDQWYSQPLVEVDPTDISWANRRVGARGRFARPAEAPPTVQV